jgi:hypothetical protein
MPGKVLAKHGIVERDGTDYRLSTEPSLLSSEERDESTMRPPAHICKSAERRSTTIAEPLWATLNSSISIPLPWLIILPIVVRHLRRLLIVMDEQMFGLKQQVRTVKNE